MIDEALCPQPRLALLERPTSAPIVNALIISASSGTQSERVLHLHLAWIVLGHVLSPYKRVL